MSNAEGIQYERFTTVPHFRSASLRPRTDTLAHAVSVLERQCDAARGLVSEILTTLKLPQNRKNIGSESSALDYLFELVDHHWSDIEARIDSMEIHEDLTRSDVTQP